MTSELAPAASAPDRKKAVDFAIEMYEASNSHFLLRVRRLHGPEDR